MNQVVLLGRICNDVELRYLDSGMAVTTITLAVDRPKKRDPGLTWNTIRNMKNFPPWE